MRLSRTAFFFLALSFICLVTMGQSYASVVTVDVAGKSATSDVKTLEAKQVKAQVDQIGVFVMNTIFEPQVFTLKFNGLGHESYDIYVNKAFKWTKPVSELASGIEFTVDGRIVDPALIRCLEAVKEPIQKAYDRINASKAAEPQRVCGTLNQAKSWARTSLQREQAWRSVSVVLAPTGRMLRPMGGITRGSDIETARAVTRACWLLQQARDRMYHGIHDPSLRNEAVVAMTPMDFSATYSTRNGKPHVDAKLLNNCDLPVNGSISMALPAGWKSTAKKLKIDNLKSGETFNLAFDLVAPSKTAAAPDSIQMAANLTVVQDAWTASLKVRAAKANPK